MVNKLQRTSPQKKATKTSKKAPSTAPLKTRQKRSASPSDNPNNSPTENPSNPSNPSQGKLQDDLIEIRKYTNRRLYCKNFSEYVVLEDVANMIKDGKRVVVQDATSGKDITRLILTQIILEAEGKDNNPLLPTSFLQSLIGLYGNGVNHFLLPKFLEQSIKTFENSTKGFESYLDKLFDDMPGGNPMNNPIMNPFRDMSNMNRKLFEINKEVMRNSMQMMMGDEWQSSFGKDMFPESDDENIAVSQKRRRQSLLKRSD